MNIMGIIFELLIALIIYWYYHHFMHTNSYFKNVVIYAIITLALEWFVGDITNVFSVIILILASIINVKILEYVQKNTTSVITFMLFGEVCLFIAHVIIKFVATGAFGI